jgi:Cytochrome c oxidase assembly protein CtaG/Cox11
MGTTRLSKPTAQRSTAIATALLFLSVFLTSTSEGADPITNLEEPARVIQSYLRAVYARDYLDAYRYISAADRRVKDVNRYARQRGAFVGGALQVTRRVAGLLQIRVNEKSITPNRIQAIAKVSIPEPDKLSPLLLNWEIRYLSPQETRHYAQILETLDHKKRQGSLDTIEVEEQLELIKDSDGWRIFLNWAGGVKIPLSLLLANTPDVEAALSKKEVVVQPGEMFEVTLKIKNRSSRRLLIQIGHDIEPYRVARFLDFVECGFLRPVTLEPGSTQEYPARYLLREIFPEGVRQLNLSYEFNLLR